jgi:hypothetical protein
LSGVETVFPVIQSPSGSQWIQFGGLDYNATSGLWAKTVQIPQFCETGSWTIPYFECRDNIQNTVRYTYGDDFIADFTVLNGSPFVVPEYYLSGFTATIVCISAFIAFKMIEKMVPKNRN